MTTFSRGQKVRRKVEAQKDPFWGRYRPIETSADAVFVVDHQNLVELWLVGSTKLFAAKCFEPYISSEGIDLSSYM